MAQSVQPGQTVTVTTAVDDDYAVVGGTLVVADGGSITAPDGGVGGTSAVRLERGELTTADGRI